MKWCAAAAVSAAVLAVGASALAQSGIPNNNWRQTDRPPRDESIASPQHFAFELRFGPYYPEVDDEFVNTPGPYERAFGSGGQFYFGLELDWQALRIPYVGAIGPGYGWGITSRSSPAKREGTDIESGQDTSLTIMPLHLSLVLRADELMRRTGIPLVPYGKLGVGFALWWSHSGGDTASYDGVVGKDTTWGIHSALGLMLALNWLDPHSAASLDETTGINHAYLFGEWMNAQLNGLGSRPQMRVGTSTWVLGLALDF